MTTTAIPRRTLLLGAAAGVGAAALGLGVPTPAQAATFVKGADISWMPQMEAGGYYWNNSAGQRQDLFTILKVRDSLRQFITGIKGFGGLGTFYWEPEGYSPFTGYGSSAWDPGTRRPTAALDGFR